MERLEVFLPSIIAIAFLAGITWIWLRFVSTRPENKIKSLDWISNNKLRVTLMLQVPTSLIWWPVAEELIFRAPIIVMFGYVSDSAWYGIIASGLVFGAMHLYGQKIVVDELIGVKLDGEPYPDNTVEAAKIHAQRLGKKLIWGRRLFQASMVSILGIVSGYFGIEYQSIWVSVAIHSAWNLIVPIMATFIVMALMLVITFLYIHLGGLYMKVNPRAWRRRREWKRIENYYKETLLAEAEFLRELNKGSGKT